MKEVRASELMAGIDSEFVTNAYCALLLRLPEPGGFRHYMALIDGEPGARLRILKDIAGSEECVARKAVTLVEDDVSGVDPDDMIVLGRAWQNYQLPVLRALALSSAKVAEVIHLVNADIESAMTNILAQEQAANPTSGGRTALDGYELEVRLSSVEKSLEMLKSGFESLHGFATKEITRNLTDYFVNLSQIQLISVDERLASLERQLSDRSAR